MISRPPVAKEMDVEAHRDLKLLEAAELAYLSLKECGLEPVAIFDVETGSEFLGMPVRAISEHGDVSYDLIIVASLERSGQQVGALIDCGVQREKLFPLRQELLPR